MIAGKTIISEEVFIDLVKIATAKVETVASGTGQKNVLAAIAKTVAERVAPQINVKKSEAGIPADQEDATPATVSLELRINVLYGQNIPDTVNKVRQSIKDEVERFTGYKIEKIDIIVDKLVKPAEPETIAE